MWRWRLHMSQNFFKNYLLLIISGAYKALSSTNLHKWESFVQWPIPADSTVIPCGLWLVGTWVLRTTTYRAILPAWGLRWHQSNGTSKALLDAAFRDQLTSLLTPSLAQKGWNSFHSWFCPLPTIVAPAVPWCSGIPYLLWTADFCPSDPPKIIRVLLSYPKSPSNCHCSPEVLCPFRA